MVIAVFVGAMYFANALNADFPGADTIRSLTDSVAGLNTQTANETAETDFWTIEDTPTPNEYQAVSIPTLDTTYRTSQQEQEKFNNPAERHMDLQLLMLKLTNEHRAKAGVPPVQLGRNPAAQLHAEESLRGCYASHWDQWGLKPNHRYTITGGTGADGENGSGLDYCIKSDQNYAPNDSIRDEVAKTVQGWMESPGHRRNLLNPAHTVLNIGIAWDKYNTNMVQQFSSDYISYLIRPNIDSQGTLRMEGQVSNATLNINESVNVQIHYDPPLRPLTLGQLSHTYSLCNPTRAGYIVEPLQGNSYYTDPGIKTETQEHPCIDPYQTDPNRPAPTNPNEAHLAWANAKTASAIAPPIEIENRRIIAEHLDVSGSKFNIRANLTPILRQNGPGIYTVTLWGKPLHMMEPAPLSEQSIFWQTIPPPGNPFSQFHIYTSPGSVDAKQPTHIPTPATFVLSTSTPVPPQPIKPRSPSTAPTSIPNLARISTPAPVLRNILKISTPVPTQIIPVEIQVQPNPTKSPPGLFQVKPIVEQTPTPTLEPTPIPQITYEDQDQAHGYQITLPNEWTLIQKAKEATFRSPDRTGKIRISVREFSKEMDERGFARNVRQEAIDTHAHTDEHFNIYEWEEQFTKEAQWQQKFTWTLWSTEDSCVQTNTDVIFRSRHFPSRPKAYILTLSACSERFTQHIADWENSLESFTEIIPKT